VPIPGRLDRVKRFPPFQLDTANQCLWRADGSEPRQRLLLAPKTYAVLKHLVDHAEQLVTLDELLNAVWPRVHVQPEVVKSQVLELRKVLGDDAKKPAFIETLSRRGYRFVAPVTDDATHSSEHVATTLAASSSAHLVGRDLELSELEVCLRQALAGSPQIVFVTGEPGIGKTALVDEFRHRALAWTRELRTARGQCIEGYGGKEAYFAVLEALGQLCADKGGAGVIDVLTACAPTWLMQFPQHVRPELQAMQHRAILGANRERMLRELGDALEQLTAKAPLLLMLEDLQWIDLSSIDLISALARTRRPMRLMVIGTSRTADLSHPLNDLKRELLAHGLCREIALPALNEAHISEYLTAKSGGSRDPDGLSRLLHLHSEGNPLFMTAALDHMTKRGFLVRENGEWRTRVALEDIELEIPHDLCGLIAAQIARLSAEERQALEIASVAGMTFNTIIGAAVPNLGQQGLEMVYEQLSRRHQIIRSAGHAELPDGVTVSRYQFAHALYREVLYRQLPAGRRARFHLRISETLGRLCSPTAQ
jgi:DNA-binding winged helix-turn-helix (wHTH) protein